MPNIYLTKGRYNAIKKYIRLYFECLLNDIVDDEEDERDLTSQHKVVDITDVSDQLDCAQTPGWNNSTSRWKLT